jgi:TonB family protein
MLQSNSSDRRRTTGGALRSIASENGQGSASSLSFARLTATLSGHGGGSLSSGLALDLVLHEIVEQVQSATNASGAALALIRGNDEMVCRATSGDNAPGLGIRVDTRKGLSGRCVQSRQVQLCDDTETDPHVNVEACRALNIRSILVIPVLHGEELLGVLEIFSPWPHAFGERHLQMLQASARRVVDNVRQTEEGHARTAPQLLAPPAEEPAVDRGSPESEVSALRSEEEHQQQEMPDPGDDIDAEGPRDYWTNTLTILVVVLAIVLGWMAGRVQWGKHPGPKAHPAAGAKPRTTGSSTSAPALPVGPAAKTNVLATTTSQPEARAAGTTSSAGLVVYQSGKVVFRMASLSRTKSVPRQATFSPVSSSTGSPKNSRLLALPSDLSGKYVASRIEPEYPDRAREQRIEGPVVLNARVDRSGVVEVLTVLSGDPELVASAADAVRQWRFRPYEVNGVPVEFETRVTVNFTLPEESR